METLLTVTDLAAVLKLAEQTIRRWVLKRQIPFHKIGKAVRFKPSEIERWVDGGSMAVCVGDDVSLEGDLFSENCA